MTTWWETQTAREKTLIALAVICMAGFILVQFMAVPMIKAKQTAALAYVKALQDYDAVSATVPQVSGFGSEARTVNRSPDDIRAIVISTSRESGLPISRLQSDASGALTVSLDEESAKIIHVWLADLGLRYGLTPSRVQMTSTASQGVQASVSFQTGGSQ